MPKIPLDKLEEDIMTTALKHLRHAVPIIGFPRAACGLVLAVILGLSIGEAALAVILGDRLVVAINGVPYTQRQVEAYITVKESLRKTPNDAVRTIDARNWADALEVFTQDMIILQESERLASFAGEAQQIDKFLAVVREKIEKNPPLGDFLRRLGIEQATLGGTLASVLRVAAFRRGKERQTQITGQKDGGDGDTSGRWLTELSERAVVRYFENARAYQLIQPVNEAQRDAL